MSKKVIFHVYRQKEKNGKNYYDTFEIPVQQGMTVLEGLFYIQDHLDSSLAFRYSCRGAICGSCGMTINKFPQLACKTQILPIEHKKRKRVPKLTFSKNEPKWNPKKELLIEPLPNMEVIKDLIVDMETFWAFYKKIQPYFSREITDQPPESKQSPEQAQKIEHLVYCILCGLCWTCPVSGKKPQYYGPAALAKGFRFIDDSRLSEKQRKNILDNAMNENGVPLCERIFACNEVCPKNVRPGTAIQKIRKKVREQNE
ncbi:MAG: succinate dehydrogenase/fumarate reductase iron-sulfur subunit [Asgard group archaeon]|nr:succinate dehydrogenase/fumarate reductase iron-sulfur subunit [Asgard group archaeon]